MMIDEIETLFTITLVFLFSIVNVDAFLLMLSNAADYEEKIISRTHKDYLKFLGW